jgi:presequence protease
MSSSKQIHFTTPGQTYQDFQVTRSVGIPELQCHLIELVHLPTNAQVMHIANEDTENLFCLSFPTLPEKSDGVAHILEHTVLCGSKKFPVKDPFFAMTRRSLNTFMNALTGSDFTCYPAATQIPKDFYNLLSVYLDAVFFPNLSYWSFLQEGHRLEFVNPTDKNSPLTYKGVVFNEMKGAMASPGARLAEAMHHTLFPDLTYGLNFGGDPKIIPELTYEQLLAFHKKFYHPGRCLFFFYGNMPLQPHLDFIAENALKNAGHSPDLPPIPSQPRFEKPRYIEANYPIASDEDSNARTYISFGWLTCPIIDQENALALNILEIILLDTDASPLKKAFLKSGLCTLVNSYIDTDINEIPWTITLRGCNKENADAAEKLLRKTLEDLAEQGIPLVMVENAIHQLELFRSEIGGDHGPFGLALFMRSALLKHHKVNPEEGLKIHTLFDVIHRHVLLDPNFFGNLIRKYLLNNTHFARVVMTPDKELNARELAQEESTLGKLRKTMSEKQVEKILAETHKLSELQKAQDEEDIDVLPKMSLEDVPKISRNFPLKREQVGTIEVFHHACFTNEIVYADLTFNLPELAEEDLSYVRLFSILMTQMGCGGRNYAENLEFIQANTGGVNASLTFNLQASSHHQFYPSINIHSKALHRKVEKLFLLFQDITQSIDFTDLHRLKEVMQKHCTALESSLSQQALRYAINLSAAGLDVPSKIANSWYGLEYFFKVKELGSNLNNNLHFLSEKMQELQHKLLGLETPHLVLTCDSNAYDELKGRQFYGLAHLITKPYQPWKGGYTVPHILSQGRAIASPVAFIAKVLKTISYVHPDAPALAVGSSLIDNLVLHPIVREQGGAYGSGAVSNTISGNFYFYSHRDPNINRTLDAFEMAVKTILQGDFHETDLNEAKLEIVQGLDEPVSPGSRGNYAYGWYREGKTQEIRQAFRNRLLNLTCEDVIAAIKQHIAPKISTGAAVIFAGRELLEKENEILKSQGLAPLPVENI